MQEAKRTIDRLLMFADYCKRHELCSSRIDFEKKCGLSRNYLYNTAFNAAYDVRSTQLAKIYKAFPALNLTWAITGEGEMLNPPTSDTIKDECQKLRKKIMSIKRIVSEEAD